MSVLTLVYVCISGHNAGLLDIARKTYTEIVDDIAGTCVYIQRHVSMCVQTPLVVY